MPPFPPLQPGDPVPWFKGRASNNPEFDFSAVAGRYVVLCFLGSAAAPPVQPVVRAVTGEHRHLFDDERAAFFGVTVDRRDLEERRVEEMLPGIRYFWDFDGAISRRYGAAAEDGRYRPFWLVLDPMLRVLASVPFDAEGHHVAHVMDLIAGLPPVARHAGLEVHAPVLILPRVFEPAFCRHLIQLYERHGGEESGFMRDVDGRTVAVLDHRHKRRADYTIEDEAVRTAARECIRRRVAPEIRKAFQFTVTRMERYIVACYDGGSGGHFRAHRDNTTKGTAHRRFAVTINLNAEAFEGGELWFPEFGPRTYKAPTGGAVVFSCSLLHEATPVTSGVRYAFLPFLYDDAAARIRAEHNRYLGEGVGAYRADPGLAAVGGSEARGPTAATPPPGPEAA